MGISKTPKKGHRGSIEESAKAAKKSNIAESKGANSIFLRKMLFLTSELGEKDEITILPARENAAWAASNRLWRAFVHFSTFDQKWIKFTEFTVILELEASLVEGR